MVIYIIKFSVCLALFVVFYKLFLENQTMHRFKRFYLLFALVFALSVPFITFIDYVEPTFIVQTLETSFEPIYETQIVEAPKVDYVPIILWSIYGLGVLLFSVKFILNLVHIFNKIRKNETHPSQSFMYVLLNDLVIPHSFFKYIFLNKQGFKTQQIPKEVLIHEQTHVRQKHSLDVLALELLQIVFWFHPLIYVLKHAIRLNHEFLADEAVINQGAEPSAYQKLLIAFSAPESNRQASKNQLASAINYSSIKKRFKVMNTHTSKRNNWLRSIILLPLIAFSIYGFSERKEVVLERQIIETIDLYLNEKGELLLDDKIILFSDIEKMYQQNKTLMVSVRTYPGVTEEEKNALMSKIKAIGIKKFSICTSPTNVPDLLEPGQSLSKSEKQGYKDLNDKKVYVVENGNWSEVDSHLEERSQEQATPEEVEEYNKMAKHINSQNPNNTIIKQKDSDRLKSLYNKMSNEQKANAEKFPKLIDFPKQQKATPEEISEYNILAKHCNSELSKQKPIIKVKEVERVKFLYNKMSSDQKKNAVSFPDFSKAPPPPPPAKNTSIKASSKKPIEIEEVRMKKEIINGKTFSYYIEDGEKKYWDKYGPIDKKDLPQPQTREVTEVIEANAVLTPPAAKSPLNHILDMVKKGATFYFEGKSISSDEAHYLLKKNKDLNISTLEIDTDEPKVYISKEIKVPYDYRITPFKDKRKSVETTSTNLVINTDNLEELKNYNWNKLKTRLSENDPDTMVSVEFNLNKPVLFDGSKIDSFSHKISCKVSELDGYISKSQIIISKLEAIK